MTLQMLSFLMLFAAVVAGVLVVAQWWPGGKESAGGATTGAASAAANPKRLDASAGQGLDQSERPRLLRDLRLSERPQIDAWLRKFPLVARLQLLMTQAGVARMADQSLLLMALITVVSGALLLLVDAAWWMAVMAGLGAGLIPLLWAIYKKRKRMVLFDQQLPDFLDSVARAMQAGNSFSGALSVVSKEAQEPIGSEFRRMFEEINFGRSVKEGLESLALRVESDDVRYFVIAVLIHQQTGGSLTGLLLSLSALIRDRQRLRKLGRVLSAEGRMSAWILGILPFATGLVMYAANPDFISILWTNPTGYLLVQTMLILMVVGMAWIWKVVRFRI